MLNKYVSSCVKLISLVTADLCDSQVIPVASTPLFTTSVTILSLQAIIIIIFQISRTTVTIKFSKNCLEATLICKDTACHTFYLQLH